MIEEPRVQVLASAQERRYITEAIPGRLSRDSLTILHSPEHRASCERLLDEAGHARDHVEGFYGESFRPEVIVCLYPSQAEMERAFGRALPHDQCCFVPVKGARSIVCFTARIAAPHLRQVMVHELSHIYFSLSTGNREVNQIQQTLPVWLDEGLALWLDGFFRPDLPGVRARRRALLREGCGAGDLPRLRELYTYFNRMDPGEEFGPKGQMAYAFSDHCVKRLIEGFGTSSVARFVRALSSSPTFDRCFSDHFGMDLDRFGEDMAWEALAPDPPP